MFIGETEINLESFKEGNYDITAFPGGIVQISNNNIKNADYIEALPDNGLYAENFDFWNKGTFELHLNDRKS